MTISLKFLLSCRIRSYIPLKLYRVKIFPEMTLVYRIRIIMIIKIFIIRIIMIIIKLIKIIVRIIDIFKVIFHSFLMKKIQIYSILILNSILKV